MECPICLDEIPYETPHETVKTPCHHVFHRTCLHAWMLQSNTCPCCRSFLYANSPMIFTHWRSFLDGRHTIVPWHPDEGGEGVDLSVEALERIQRVCLVLVILDCLVLILMFVFGITHIPVEVVILLILAAYPRVVHYIYIKCIECFEQTGTLLELAFGFVTILACGLTISFALIGAVSFAVSILAK